MCRYLLLFFSVFLSDFTSWRICCGIAVLMHCVYSVLTATVFVRFQNQYGNRVQTALAYAMNSEFGHVLAAQMVWPI